MPLESFSNLFLWMEQFGMLDALLPFLLIFTLVFAALQRTKIIGSGEKRFNVIVALVLSFSVVLPHLMGKYPPGKDVVVIINTALPNISVVLVAILTILLLIGVFAPVNLAGTMLGGILVLGSIVAVVYFFGSAAGIWAELPPFLSFLNDPDTQALIIILVVFGLVLWFITREEGGAHIGGPLGGFFKMFRDAIQPK